MIDTQKEEKHSFSCVNCGHEFMPSPPDDEHVRAYLNACDQGDSIALRYTCKNCSSSTVIHWDMTHSYLDSRKFDNTTTPE